MRYTLGSWTLVKFDNGEDAIAVSQTWFAKLQGKKVIISKKLIDKELEENE